MIAALLLLLGGGLLASGGASVDSTPTKTPKTPSGTGSSSSSSTPSPSSGGIVYHDGRGAKLTNAQRRENYDAAYLMGKSLEDAGVFGPGFAEWLRVVAFTEARGNPAAGSDAFSNAARGLLGLRATTAWNESETINGVKRVWNDNDAELAFRNGAVTSGEVDALKDMPWTIALAAHNVNRLRKYTAGGPLTLLGARRGWAFPSLVPDHDNSSRPELLTRKGGWNDALKYFKLPASFADRPMVINVSRADFPSVYELHAIIEAAINGEGGSSSSSTGEPDYDEGLVAGTREDGTTGGSEGYAYAWALGQRLDLTWTWGADRWPPNANAPDATEGGDTSTRNQSVSALSAAVAAWEAQLS